jgi:hypothetical protein
MFACITWNMIRIMSTRVAFCIRAHRVVLAGGKEPPAEHQCKHEGYEVAQKDDVPTAVR